MFCQSLYFPALFLYLTQTSVQLNGKSRKINYKKVPIGYLMFSRGQRMDRNFKPRLWYSHTLLWCDHHDSSCLWGSFNLFSSQQSQPSQNATLCPRSRFPYLTVPIRCTFQKYVFRDGFCYLVKKQLKLARNQELLWTQQIINSLRLPKRPWSRSAAWIPTDPFLLQDH